MKEYIKKNLQPLVIYVAGSICILLFSLSDSLTIVETLKDAFAWPIPYLFGFGVILTNELIFFGVIFAFKNLFAFGKIPMATWAFYLSLVICLGGLGAYSALNVIRHIEALGAKNRSQLHAVDFSTDPALVRADKAVNELRRQLISADSSIFGVARAASGMATASMAFLRVSRGDTSRVKRDQLSNASRASRSGLNVTTTLNDLQRGRQFLLTSLLHAQDRRDSVFAALDRRYRWRSAQDVIEMDMGINLKGRVATLTVSGTIGVMLVMMMTSFAYGGRAEFFPFDFSAHGSSPAMPNPTNAPATPNPRRRLRLSFRCWASAKLVRNMSVVSRICG